jgi:hypothetical protein
MIYRKSSHPQPLPARREGHLLLRQIPVNIFVTHWSTAPSLFKGGVRRELNINPMKYIPGFSVVAIFLVVFLTGCKKESQDINPGIISDNIVFTDISPDTAVTSVRYWETLYYDRIPVPSDSSAAISLDLDQDDVNDILIVTSTSFDFVSASNPGANYCYKAGFYMIDSSDSIAFNGTACDQYSIAQVFQKDSIIAGLSGYSRSVKVYMSTPIMSCYLYAPIGDVYIGFKLFRNGGYKFGWIQIKFVAMNITVKEFAVNQTINCPIRAGQKQ